MEAEINKRIKENSDEVRDIIDRMPSRTGRIIALVLFLLSGLLIFLGLRIEYPEKVSGPVTITARQAPVRLVTNISGKIRLLKSNTDTLVENELIGYIENPADLNDILRLEEYLERSGQDTLFYSQGIPDSLRYLSLGDLNSYYVRFLNASDKFLQNIFGKPFEKQNNSFEKLLQSQKRLLAENLRQLNTKRNALKLTQKSIKRDSILFKSSAIAEQDIDRSSINYYSILQVVQEMEERSTSLKIQLDDTKHKIEMLKLEEVETGQSLKMELFASLNELKASVRKWKLTYTFISPFNGILEYLNFWRDDDFIDVGTEVFSILPSDNPILGQVYLPSQGAGKVEPGQEVIIKLDNYPYIEYGSITGKVKTISGISSVMNLSGGQNISTYLILIDLPEMLTTNYGMKLDFRYEIRGVADILTKKRKLLMRLFDNLKYIASKK
jgi:hypothetical protein